MKYLSFYLVGHEGLDDLARIFLGIQVIQASVELEDIAQQIINLMGFPVFAGIGNMIDTGPAQITALGPADELQPQL